MPKNSRQARRRHVLAGCDEQPGQLDLLADLEATVIGFAEHHRLPHTLATHHVYGTVGQFLVMLLVALHKGGGGTKQRVLSFIKVNKWFDVQPEDTHAFLSRDPGDEPRWETMMAFARLILKLLGCLLVPHQWNHWQLNTRGKNLAASIEAAFRNRDFGVHNCYLFSHEFKLRLDPQWAPSEHDAQRPRDMYRDWHALEMFIKEKQLELKQLFE